MKTAAFRALAHMLLLIGLASGAHAAVLQYSLSGGAVAEWELDRRPTPDAFDGTSFEIFSVNGTFAGTTPPVMMAFYTAGNAPNSGGLAYVDSNFLGIVAPGEQLFTGLTSAPVMRTGLFLLDGLFLGPEGQIILVPGLYHLTVIGPPLPEPASWILLAAGMGGVGGGMRRFRRMHRQS